MRRVLLAGAAALALSLVPAPRGAEGFACANCVNEVTEVIREIKRAAEVAKMVNNGVQQVQQARAVVNAFTNVRDLGSAVGAFGMLGVQNPLPINPYALQGLLNGTGGAQGMLGNLGGLYTGTTSANSQFQVPVTLQVGRWINQQLAAVSGSQAASLSLHQAAEERARQISLLQAQIAANAGNPSAQAMLANQLAAYQAQVQGQQVQAIALANYSAQQQRAAEIQQQARFQQSAEEILQQARARGWF